MTRTKTIACVLLLAALAPALMAPSGGFPSRPTFQAVTVSAPVTGVQTLSLSNTNTTDTNTARLSISAGSSNLQFGVCPQGQSSLCKLTGGPAVPSAWIETFSAIPIAFGTGNAFGGQINADNGLTWGSPTGGSKGAGTINATNLYLNGVAVTPTRVCAARLTQPTSVAGQVGCGGTESMSRGSAGVFTFTHNLAGAVKGGVCGATGALGTSTNTPMFCTLSLFNTNDVLISTYNVAGVATDPASNFNVVLWY